ncbi:MAG TPA: hypothetical protein VFZ01_17375 [Geminicoccaceae bacterium]
MHVGARFPTQRTEIHSLKVRKTRKGIRVGSDASDLRLTNIWFDRIVGTCLVAEHQGDLIVDHAFFNRCAYALKLRSRQAGSSLTVRNSLIRIDNGPGLRPRGRLLHGLPARSDMQVYFEDNIVVTAKRLDSGSLSVIAGNCAGNTLIWIGEGSYPGSLPGCFDVVEGRQAWREARSAWKKRYLERLAGAPDRPAPGGGTPPPSGLCAVPEVPDAIPPRKTVGNGSPASCTEGGLRQALAGGGTITFACGSSPVTIPVAAELVISSPTVLDGAGVVTLDGQDRTRIIRNDSRLILKKMALTRGRKEYVWDGFPNGGGAVKTSYGHHLYVVDSTFTDNWTSDHGSGGAIFQAGAGSLTVIRSLFQDNVGGGGGAIYNLLAELHVVDSAFVRNQGSSGRKGGGGIMTDGASGESHSGRSGGEIVVCGSTFDANDALATGGGAYLFAYGTDAVSVMHSTFTGNTATPNEGGLSMGGGLRLGASPALVSRSTFRNNIARMGGGIATQGDEQTQVRDSTFACNSSDIEGGNVLSSGNSVLGC